LLVVSGRDEMINIGDGSDRRRRDRGDVSLLGTGHRARALRFRSRRLVQSCYARGRSLCGGEARALCGLWSVDVGRQGMGGPRVLIAATWGSEWGKLAWRGPALPDLGFRPGRCTHNAAAGRRERTRGGCLSGCLPCWRVCGPGARSKSGVAAPGQKRGHVKPGTVSHATTYGDVEEMRRGHRRSSARLGSARLPVPAGRCVVRRSKFADHEGHSSICRLSAAAGAGFWLRRPRRGIPSPQYQQAGGHHCASGLQLGRGVVSLSYQQRDGCQSEGACMPCRQRQRQAYVVHPLGEEKAARRMQRARACWRVYAAALHRSIPCLPACLPAFLPSNCPRDEEEEGMEADRTRHDRSKLLPPWRRAP
jgi:hypothetical protein